MDDNKFEVGNIVKFNVGKPDGPVFSGFISHVGKNGTFRIQPHRAGYIPGNVQFFNVTKAEK